MWTDPNYVDGVCSIPFSTPYSLGEAARSAPDPRREKRTPEELPLRDFVAGPENVVAVEAVRGVLYATRGEYSPLVLHGPTGVGKTHLASGLAELWRGRAASESKNLVLEWNFADFARRYAEAIDTQASDEWNRRFLQVSLLVIEDIDAAKGKDAAQEELVRILDLFATDGRQVIITAKQAPERSKQLCPRLRSRLCAGLAVSVASPGPAARETIIEQLAEQFDVTLESSKVRHMATQAPATYPQLRGLMLELRTSMRGDQLDERVLETAINRRTSDKTPTIETIAASSARYHGVKLADLRSPSRRRQVVTARGVAMVLARELTDISYQQIGAFFGGRDHTTVLHGCRQTALRSEQDEATKAAIDELRGQLSRT